jgi:FkbM family methyltransferase
MKAVDKVIKSARKHYRLFGTKGLAKRALICLPGATCEFEASIPRSREKILIRLGTTDVAAYEHVFIDEEYDFSLAYQPALIVDAGANVGMSAAYFSLRYPAATIIAVEPEQTNFNVLRRNAQFFPKVIPIEAAFWSHEGTVQMTSGHTGHWGSRVAESNDSSGAAVRATTVPALLDQLGIRRVDLLKIDVEGAEVEIFENAPTWIGRVSVICIELHDRFRPGCVEAFQAATAKFPVKWRQGELHCAAREGIISSPQ